MYGLKLDSSALTDLAVGVVEQGGLFCFRTHGSSMTPFLAAGSAVYVASPPLLKKKAVRSLSATGKIPVPPVQPAQATTPNTSPYSCYRTLRVGDVVLFRRAEGAAVHRIVRKVETNGWTEFIIRGDSITGPGEMVSADDVIGLVVLSERNGKIRRFDKGVWRLLGVLWVRLTPIGQLGLVLAARMWRIVRKGAGQV